MPSRWRRSRWRRRLTPTLARVLVPALVLALLLVIVVGALGDIGKQSAPYRRTVDRGFAALAGSVALQSNATGASLQSVLTGGPSMDRLTLFSTLDRVAAQTTRQADDLASDSSPPPSALAGGCRQALDDRASAAASLRQAFEGVLGGSAGTTSTSLSSALSAADSGVAAAAQGDLAWRSCQQSLRRGPGTPRLVASHWLTDPTAWSGEWQASLVSSIAASPTLAADAALGILTVSTDPAVLPSGGAPVVTSTSSLTVHVVVTNTGNVDQPGVRVTASLSGGRLGGPGSLSAFVALGAGRTMSIVLGPFAVVPGSAYTLTISATPPTGAGAATASLALQIATVPTTTTTTTTTSVPGRKG